MSTAPRPTERLHRTVALDLTPMIDVTFLLIIFFLCVTEMARVEYEQLCLPKAQRAVDEVNPPANRQIVNVVYGRDGLEGTAQVLVRGRRYSRMTELVTHLQTVCRHSTARREAPVSVKIRADSRVPYEEVQKVMVACAKAGINRISIGTAPERN